MTQHQIEIRLEETHFFTRRRCFVCDGWGEKDAVIAVLYDNGERTGQVVCDRCLRLSPEAQAAKIQETANNYRELAKILDELPAAMPPIPTYAEWEAATVRAEEAFRSAVES